MGRKTQNLFGHLKKTDAWKSSGMTESVNPRLPATWNRLSTSDQPQIQEQVAMSPFFVSCGDAIDIQGRNFGAPSQPGVHQ